ncbi:MAG: phosphohydrolase [Patescibacteria group bacterium]|nr:phosphohydrolase [Patescibacteria group bacterium]
MEPTLKQLKKDPRINAFIDHSNQYLKGLGYTDHGRRHLDIVSDRAKMIANKIGLIAKDQEAAAVAGWCHDMGNFLGRTQHHYWAAFLFSQCYISQSPDPDYIAKIIQAIVSHDKDDLKIVDKITACLVIADKSDVHRLRVIKKSLKEIKEDIHDRVNYSVTANRLLVDPAKKKISLLLKLDTNFTDIMDYFSIFVERMNYCQKAAQYLGYDFNLTINKTKLA